MIKYLLILLTFIAACQSTSTEEHASKALSIVKGETPFLYKSENDNLYLSFTQKTDSINYLKFVKRNDDGSWTEPLTISSGSNWFVNWADYPVIAKNNQDMVSHFLAKSSAGTYSYDIHFTHSDNSGEDWKKLYILHDDGKNAEHGFVSTVPYGENFFVTWLDGRKTVDVPDSTKAMTLRGAIISADGAKLQEWELDNRVCDCCQTTAAITKNGPVVIYRDRSDDEIRDMSIVRYIDGKWTAPQNFHPDNWQIAGCPVNGPRSSAVDESLAVAWFSAPEGNASVKVKFSNDNGATFGEVFTVDKGSPIGRVDIALIDKNIAFVSWMEGADILAAKVSKIEGVIDRYTIASSSESRSSGFPQLELLDDKAVFAWTDTESGMISLKEITL